MKILYDGLIYSVQKAGGVNRYFANVIKHLPDDFQPVLLTDRIRDVNWPSHPRLEVHKWPALRPERIARRIEPLYFRPAANRIRPDLVHPTYYTALGNRPLNSYGCPSVITVLDFIHAIFPEQLDPGGTHFIQQKQAILQADAVICISNSTRADLLERFPWAENKITVTPLASEIDISMAYGPEPVPERPYFLYVGARNQYKNFDTLLRAFANLSSIVPGLALSVVGAPFTPHELSLMDELKISESVDYRGFVPDNHLAKLYRCSLAFVYPSLYEGFGIPPLEAMHCETVVIAANNSSIPEVTGGAALLFDAKNVDELTDLLLATARGEIDRQTLIERGKERMKGFSWQKTSQQTAQIYRDLVRS